MCTSRIQNVIATNDCFKLEFAIGYFVLRNIFQIHFVLQAIQQMTHHLIILYYDILFNKRKGFCFKPEIYAHILELE